MIRRMVRDGMLAVARDETATVAGRTALVVAPHPDDETLGCGAAILRKVAAGTPVTVAVVTDGSRSHRSEYLPPDKLAALRRLEMAAAASRLGLAPDAVRWGGFIDGTVAEHEDAVVDLLVDLLAELKPNEVYATSADETHSDHAAVGRAARRAVRSANDRSRLLEYPVWLWNSWPLRRGDRCGSAATAAGRLLTRRLVRVRSDAFLDGKMHALQAHNSQLRRPEEVPADVDWAVLPEPVLAAAAGSAELFFPWHSAGAR
jgi:LmbE family N-acetylglucosaminyl deacetylase